MKYRACVVALIAAFVLSSMSFAQTTPAAPDTVKKADPSKMVKTEKKVEKGAMEKPAKPGMKEESLVQRLNSASSLKTFVELLKTTDLEKSLEGTGEFTVFAPSDAAFNKLPADTLNALKQDKARLTQILKNHIVASKRINMGELHKMNGQTVPTESGEALSITLVKGKLMVGHATLTGINMRTSNGPIHEIDTVLLPGMLTAPATEKVTSGEKAPAEKTAKKAVKEETKEEKK